jgi:hypothetical protein
MTSYCKLLAQQFFAGMVESSLQPSSNPSYKWLKEEAKSWIEMKDPSSLSPEDIQIQEDPGDKEEEEEEEEKADEEEEEVYEEYIEPTETGKTPEVNPLSLSLAEENQQELSLLTTKKNPTKKGRGKDILQSSVDLLLNSLVSFFRKHREYLPDRKEEGGGVQGFLLPSPQPASNFRSSSHIDSTVDLGRYPLHPSVLRQGYFCAACPSSSPKPFLFHFKRLQSDPLSWKKLRNLVEKLFSILETANQYVKWKWIMGHFLPGNLQEAIPTLPIEGGHLL